MTCNEHTVLWVVTVLGMIGVNTAAYRYMGGFGIIVTIFSLPLVEKLLESL